MLAQHTAISIHYMSSDRKTMYTYGLHQNVFSGTIYVNCKSATLRKKMFSRYNNKLFQRT